jgi:hypothetical protein
MCVLLDVIEVQQYAPQWARKIQIMTLRASPDAPYPIDLLDIFRPLRASRKPFIHAFALSHINASA